MSSAIAQPQCDWWGTEFLLCQDTAAGWGWESNQSCISASTCSIQPPPYGIVYAPSSSAASSSVTSEPRSSASRISSSVAFSNPSCEDRCQWYNDAPRPLCQNQNSGWGWENQQSCIGINTCNNPSNTGGVISLCEEPASSSAKPVPISSSSSNSSGNTTGYREGEFVLGMDISYWSEQLDNGAIYIDTDGQTKDLLDLFKNHGINFIRLRTFVDPSAPYGYTSTAGGCSGKPNAYNGKDDIIRMAKKIKAAGMGFLLDFHYSDTWADPGKQVIPQAWQNVTSVQALAEELRVYTIDVLTALQSQNALPDMVQVGNEITPGMLVHEPTNATDCWGNNSTYRSGPNGGANNSNWRNLGLLLKAGIQGVKHVDASIKTVLHIENFDDPAGVEWWVDSALNQNIDFDVLGLSSYEEFQGPASAWRTTIQGLSRRYPQLSFAIVEYNPRARLLNDIMREVPNGRGLGTFFWEPTQSGYWGNAIFTQQGNRYRANASDFAVYDDIVDDYNLRKLP